jgi:FAD:protein FMN transferase
VVKSLPNIATTADGSGKPLLSQRRMRPLMGTLCVIEACGVAQPVHAAIEQAFSAMTFVEQCMHPTRAGSDLVRLNDSVRQRLKIDQQTWAVLQLAQQIHASSGGVFDPCLQHQPGCLRDVELLPDSTVLCHVPVAIDLGGIAKGYAIDRAISALQAAGCVSGMVNAGGDLRVFGRQSQKILIRLRDQQMLELELCDQAVAVSDVHTADRPSEHQGYYWRNKNDAPTQQQVAVLAGQAAIADALTKCVIYGDELTSAILLREWQASRILPPHG